MGWGRTSFLQKHLAVNRNIAIFASSNDKKECRVKSKELHRRFVKAGWVFDHAEGSHYFYVKDGVMTEPIPYHGSKEMGTGIANKLIRRYGV